MKKTLPETAITLQANTATRMAKGATDISMAMLKPQTAESLQGWQDLNRATAERAKQLGEAWMKGWEDWFAYAQTLPGADTTPKYIERVNNIYLRAQAQFVKQLNDTTELADNVFVSYSWFAAQQVGRDG